MTSSVLKNTQDTGVPVSVRGIFSLTKELEKAQNAMAEIASIQGTQGLPAVDSTFKFGPQQPVPPELLDEKGLLNDFSETAEKFEPYSQFWKAWNMALDEPAGQPEPSTFDNTLNKVQFQKQEATDVPLNLLDVAPELADLFQDTPYEPASKSVPKSEGFVTFDTFDSMEELRGKASKETEKTTGAKTLWDIAPELAAEFDLVGLEEDFGTSPEKESFIQFDTFDSMEELRAKAAGEAEPSPQLDSEQYIEFNTYDSMEER